MSDKTFHIYLSCAPGLEHFLKQECASFGLKPSVDNVAESSEKYKESNEEPGGFLIKGSLENLYRCNLHLRTASRVSIRAGQFIAVTFAELRKKAALIEWERYLTPGQGLNLSVTCHKSRLYHTDAVSERILGAINDHFASAGSKNACRVDKDGQLILVRLVNDHCTISIDSSGTLLYKRGYRQQLAKAPLRETLAAGMILASGWTADKPLIDPFCGSGTIPIEAALIANHIPPGIAREFAIFNWPIHEPDRWQAILNDARSRITSQPLQVYGFDRDAGAIQTSVSNASRAGQKDRIVFRQQSISNLAPLDSPGMLVTNPPYGVRLDASHDLRDLYARFGSILAAQFQGWQAGILSNDRKLSGNLHLGIPVNTYRFTNGGIPVEFLLFSL